MGRGWELPEEPDNRDKRIAQLEKALEDADKRGPVVSATTTVDGKEARELTIRAVVYPALSEEKVGELLAEMMAKYPLVTDIPKPPDYQPPPERKPGGGFDLADLEAPFDWVAPTEAQITAYKASYENWVADARKIMVEAPTAWQEDLFEAVFEMDLLNTGSEAAEDVRVTIEATGSLLLRREEDDNEGDAKPASPTGQTFQAKPLRACPSPPEWKKVHRKVERPSPPGVRVPVSEIDRASRQISQLSATGLFAEQDRLSRMLRDPSYASALRDPFGGVLGRRGFGMPPEVGIGYAQPIEPMYERIAFLSQLHREPPEPDPEVFYWKDRPQVALSKRWVFECQLFRHHIAPETWVVPVIIEADALKGSAVRISVHARNLRKPTALTVPVRVDVRTRDTEALVRKLLPEAMHPPA